MPEPMNDNARIVREALEMARPLLEAGIQEVNADTYGPALELLYASFDGLTALETELVTAQADLERAREVMRECIRELAPMLGPMPDFYCGRVASILRAALAPEQKG